LAAFDLLATKFALDAFDAWTTFVVFARRIPWFIDARRTTASTRACCRYTAICTRYT
jgi:hypothetical protein